MRISVTRRLRALDMDIAHTLEDATATQGMLATDVSISVTRLPIVTAMEGVVSLESVSVIHVSLVITVNWNVPGMEPALVASACAILASSGHTVILFALVMAHVTTTCAYVRVNGRVPIAKYQNVQMTVLGMVYAIVCFECVFVIQGGVETTAAHPTVQEIRIVMVEAIALFKMLQIQFVLIVLSDGWVLPVTILVYTACNSL